MATFLFRRLLGKGYLPDSLPSVFTTTPFAAFAVKSKASFVAVAKDPKRLKGIDYSASKSGYRRRTFTIPHPIAQYFVADFIAQHWSAIRKQFKQSKFSLSAPKQAHTDAARAIEITPINEVHSITHEKLGHLAYIARSDIQAFYPSIYTHSIPWAVHGKAASKKDTDPNSAVVYFNKLDFYLRRGQDAQTVGIPIGPDTSRIIAELISVALDKRLQTLAGSNLISCVRHVDDIYMGSDSKQGADECIAAFRKSLREFGLELNEGKTRIFQASELRDDNWPRVLMRRFASYETEKKPDRVRAKFIGLFEECFELAEKIQSEAPVRFLLRRMDRDGLIKDHNWNIAENFLIKCLYDYPHTIDYISRILIWRKLFGGTISKKIWQHAVNNRLAYHISMGHDQEISWLLWTAISLKYPIGIDVANSLTTYENSVIALMSMHAKREKVLPPKTNLDFLKGKMADTSLEDEWWLFTYECAQKKWLSPSPKWTTTAGKLFQEMKSAGVFFYRSGADALSDFEENKPAIPSSGFGYEDEDETEDDVFADALDEEAW